MNKPIFCIVGKSGVGKSTYLDTLANDTHMNTIGIKELKYHTTRKKRYKSEDSYHFVSFNDFLKDYNSGNIIEKRHYNKFDEDVVYYTTKSDIEDSSGRALFCAASVDQALSYYDTLNSIYIINIEVNTKQRLQRLISRCNNEDDCYEVCRRAIEEDKEYNKLFERDFGDKIITVDNSDQEYMSSEEVILHNTGIITNFIYNNSHPYTNI